MIGVDDDWTRAAADRLERAGKKVVRVSVLGRCATASTPKSATKAAASCARRRQGAASGRARRHRLLRGAHNAQNAACAIAACLALGLDLPAIQKGLASFPGLAHRMQQVGAKGKVLFVNDSKATNADSAAKALASFTDIFWIAGGKPKTGGITSLAEFFPRIAKAYLIGEAAGEFAKTLDGKVPLRNQRDAVGGGRRRRARCGGLGRQGAGGAAVAGLRLVRPVPEFRGAREGVRRSGAGAPGGYFPLRAGGWPSSASRVRGIPARLTRRPSACGRRRAAPSPLMLRKP